MKKWHTTMMFGKELSELDVLTEQQKYEGKDEMNIALCNKAAAITIRAYKTVKNQAGAKRAAKYVSTRLSENLPLKENGNDVFTMSQIQRTQKIVKDLFKWHWFPFSRIRRNMKRLGA